MPSPSPPTVVNGSNHDGGATTETTTRDEIAGILTQRPCPDANVSRGPTTCECWFDYRNIDRIDLTEAVNTLLRFRGADDATQKTHAGVVLREGRQYKNKVKGRARKNKCYKMEGLPHRVCKGKLIRLFRRGNDWLVTAEREADPDRANAPNPATVRSRKSAKRRKLAELLGDGGPILYYWTQPLHRDTLGRLQQMIRDLVQRPDCDIGIARKETIFEPKESAGFSGRLMPGRNFPLFHAYTTTQFVDQSLLPEGKQVRLLADGIQYKQKTQCIGYSDFPVLHDIREDTLATLRHRKKRLFLGEAIRALPPAQEEAWGTIVRENPGDPYGQKNAKSGDPFAVSLAAMSLHVQSDWQITRPSVYMPHIDIFGDFVCFVQISGTSFTFVSETTNDPSKTGAYFDEEESDGRASWRDYSTWKRSLERNDPDEHKRIVAYETEFVKYVNNDARSRSARLFRIRIFRLAPGGRLAFAAGKCCLQKYPAAPTLTTVPAMESHPHTAHQNTHTHTHPDDRNIPARLHHSPAKRRQRRPDTGSLPLSRMEVLTNNDHCRSAKHNYRCTSMLAALFVKASKRGRDLFSVWILSEWYSGLAHFPPDTG